MAFTIAEGILIAVCAFGLAATLLPILFRIIAWVFREITKDCGVAFLWVYGLFDGSSPRLTFGAGVILVTSAMMGALLLLYVVMAL